MSAAAWKPNRTYRNYLETKQNLQKLQVCKSRESRLQVPDFMNESFIILRLEQLLQSLISFDNMLYWANHAARQNTATLVLPGQKMPTASFA